MRNYLSALRLTRWALQDSNLRPSDYESVRAHKQDNDLYAVSSAPARQTATSLATSRQQSATQRATQFPKNRWLKARVPSTDRVRTTPIIPDPYSDSKIFVAWKVAC